jgi:hypothetical protein
LTISEIHKLKLAIREKAHVPEGQLKIARRFNAGEARKKERRPGGTLELCTIAGENPTGLPTRNKFPLANEIGEVNELVAPKRRPIPGVPSHQLPSRCVGAGSPV